MKGSAWVEVVHLQATLVDKDLLIAILVLNLTSTYHTWIVGVDGSELGVAWAAALHVRRVDRRVVTVQAARRCRPVVRLVDRHLRLLRVYLAVLGEGKRARMVAGAHDFATIAVAVTLLIRRVFLRDDSFDLRRDMLHGATSTEVARSARLAPTVPLALDDLTADLADVWALALVHGLVYVHGGLDMVPLWVESSHLDVLNLGLIDAGTFSREKLLLMVTQDSVLNLVAFGRRALTLGKLLVDTVGLVHHASTLYLDVLVAQSGLLACVAFADLVVLDMNHSRRAGRHML